MVDIHDIPDAPEKNQEPQRAAAVALKNYGINTGGLPKIVASGYGKLAEQIVALALSNGVKVREDKDLAQMLAAIDVDNDIPSEALIAVAEILAYVYKANGNYHLESTATELNESTES